MVVVVAPKDPEEEDLDQGPGEDLTLDPDGIGQGRPGGADRTVDLAWASSQIEAGPNLLAAVTATVAATTTTAGGTTTMMRRRRALLRMLAKVRILSSPLPLPLWKLGVPHSLMLLLSCC